MMQAENKNNLIKKEFLIKNLKLLYGNDDINKKQIKKTIIEGCDIVTFLSDNTVGNLGILLAGIIGSIPYIGALAASVFSIVWNNLFTKEDGQNQTVFIDQKTFENKMAEFRIEMENMVNQRLSETIISLANVEFNTLQRMNNSLVTYITAFEQRFGGGKFIDEMKSKNIEIPSYLNQPTDQQFATISESASAEMIRTQYLIVLGQMDKCRSFFTSFSNQERLLMVGNLIHNSSLYILLLRDVYNKGLSWGFDPKYIETIPTLIEQEIDFLFSPTNTDKVLHVPTINSADLVSVYNKFAYLDYKRFPINGHPFRFEINASNNTALIPSSHDNGNQFKYVLDQYNAQSVGGVRLPKGLLMDCVYDLDFWAFESLNYRVSRTSRSFSKVTAFTQLLVDKDIEKVVIQIDNQLLPHSPSKVQQIKDHYFYTKGFQTQYIVNTIDFKSLRFGFDFKIFATSDVAISSTHTIFILN